MPKFLISVCRIGYSIKGIEVEADSEEQANELALEQAPNESYGSEHASEYELEDDVKGKNRLLIVVEGGVVQSVHSDFPNDIEVIIRDYDIAGTEEVLQEDKKGYKYTENNLDPFNMKDLEK